jgi:hypothetical protein
MIVRQCNSNIALDKEREASHDDAVLSTTK